MNNERKSGKAAMLVVSDSVHTIRMNDLGSLSHRMHECLFLLPDRARIETLTLDR